MKKVIKHILVIMMLMVSILTAQAQVKIGSNPTVIESTSNLEVEASTPNRKVKVNKTTGQLTIQDGTQGNGRILTSDAVGGASWRTQKLTEVTSFSQITGVLINLLPKGSFVSCSAGIDPIGTSVPSCAVDLNMNGSFTTVNPINDIILDLSGQWASTTPVTDGGFDMKFVVYVDKTKPDVFEKVSSFTTIKSGSTCQAESFNYKTVLKNMPVRAYKVKVYAAPYNYGSESSGTFGIGQNSRTTPYSCGSSVIAQSLVVTVSQ